ncbi:MAG: HDIG domain-containing protein [Synechococcales bacterium]|nr:HDIG domain-containing protein [Synechococcales bacterium]
MKSFRSLTQHVDQWWRSQSSGLSQRLSPSASSSTSERRQPAGQKAVAKLKAEPSLSLSSQPLSDYQSASSQRGTGHQIPKKSRNIYSSSILLTVVVASLTSAIGYRLYNEPKLDVGTIAPQTLRAPQSAVVEDEVTTQARREAASKGTIPILMIDPTVNQRIYQTFQRSLDRADELRKQAGAFPFIETSILSTATQNYLRQASEAEWRSTVAALEGAATDLPLSMPDPSGEASSSDNPDASQASQQLAIIELQAYQRVASADDFSALKQLIIRARQRYNVAVVGISTTSVNKPDNIYDATLLQLPDSVWEETKIGMRHALEGILTQGISPGLPNDLIRAAVRFQLNEEVPRSAVLLATNILASVIKPNLIEDPEQTRLFAEQAAEAVEPELVEVRRGEAIVEAGDTIDQAQFVLLDHFNLSRRGIDWVGLVAFAGIVTLSVGVFLVAERRFRPHLRRRDHILIVLLTLTTPLVIALKLPSTNLPALGLLVGSFYGSALGLTVVGLLSVVLPIGMDVVWTQFVASAASSLVGTLLADRLRSREELAMLGGAVGIVQGLVYLILSLILSTASSPVWFVVLTAALVQGLMGVAWSIVALGVSPYLENLFDLVTPIRLVELSNPNRPMLKRLASDAPGTFQHTLFVASLAEAAARELGCNVELVRAGTLYHDVGKMHDPQGFIENQMGTTNKHDIINNPWKSANIIKKHVSEGLVMARKCRLPGAIQAFIPEHQGTMLITYFYYQAQQWAKEDPSIVVREEDFRYDGPIPQSRETGIVMLADSCEAALRSLKDATHEEALAMVNRILRARWQDQQLVDSGLTRPEMARIAEIFVRVWQQYNHKRIPYPKAAIAPQPSPVSS